MFRTPSFSTVEGPSAFSLSYYPTTIPHNHSHIRSTSGSGGANMTFSNDGIPQQLIATLAPPVHANSNSCDSTKWSNTNILSPMMSTTTIHYGSSPNASLSSPPSVDCNNNGTHGNNHMAPTVPIPLQQQQQQQQQQPVVYVVTEGNNDITDSLIHQLLALQAQMQTSNSNSNSNSNIVRNGNDLCLPLPMMTRLPPAMSASSMPSGTAAAFATALLHPQPNTASTHQDLNRTSCHNDSASHLHSNTAAPAPAAIHKVNGQHYSLAAVYEGYVKRYNPVRGFGFLKATHQVISVDSISNNNNSSSSNAGNDRENSSLSFSSSPPAASANGYGETATESGSYHSGSNGQPHSSTPLPYTNCNEVRVPVQLGDIFVHQSYIHMRGFRSLPVGGRVRFAVGYLNGQHSFQAVDVSLLP